MWYSRDNTNVLLGVRASFALKTTKKTLGFQLLEQPISEWNNYDAVL